MGDTIRLLAVGDIHLGRRPSGLPADGVDHNRLTPAAAWRGTVDEALERGVAAVLLAGDVVEQAQDFYEAYWDLHNGVRRLTEAGIPVLGVAGNHDVAVLPRLAEAIPEFRLVGAGGQWEAVHLPGPGGGVHVWGWSFPGPAVTESPLAHLPHRPEGGAVLGLLHCDRDASNSHHAPVRGTELAEAPVDAWLLGHIHQPDALDGERPMGYLGTLSPLDRGEPGPRGPWLIECDGPGRVRARHLRLAPLRWEPLDVDASDLDAAGAVHARIVAVAGESRAAVTQAGEQPLALGCRLRITGRTDLGAAIRRELDTTDPTTTPLFHEPPVTFVVDWRVDTEPAVDLDALAQQGDPAGLLARRLQVLARDPDDPERRQLVREGQRHLAEVVRRAEFRELQPPPPDEAAAAQWLERAARQALEALLAQRHGETP